MNLIGTDCFGRTVDSYNHLHKVKEKKGEEGVKAYLRGCADYHFTCLKDPNLRGKLSYDFKDFYQTKPHQFSTQDRKASAGTFGILSNNFQAIDSVIRDTYYNGLVIDDFVFVNESRPDGARSYQVRIRDFVGLGEVAPRSMEGTPPVADSNLRGYTADLYPGWIVAKYSEQDDREASFVGDRIRAQKIEAAAMGAGNHLQNVFLYGDNPDDRILPKTRGFFNQEFSGSSAMVTRETLTTVKTSISGIDTTKSFEEQSDDVQRDIIDYLIRKIGVDTNEIAYKMGAQYGAELCIVLPTNQYDHITTQPYGDNRDKTLMDYINMANTWTKRTGKPIMWKSRPEGENAGTANNGTSNNTSRIVVYVKSPDVQEMAIPIRPRLVRVWQGQYHVELPMEYYFGTLQIMRKDMTLYLDGS